MDRDPNTGRFLRGNTYAAIGGRARADKLTEAELSAIGKKGFAGLVAKRFDGDATAAKAWITAKGLAALDEHYLPEFRVFHDPGPMPNGKEE